VTKAAKYRPQLSKRKQPKSYASGGYASGLDKPCPTCYSPMERAGASWNCTKHGAPDRL
jgi:hypothetical protein